MTKTKAPTKKESREKVYLVTCTYERWNKTEKDYDEKEDFVLGIFDTSERAIAYLRKYYDRERELNEYRSFSRKEDTNGNVFAEVWEKADAFNECSVYTKLSMRPVELNAAWNPDEDIVGHFVG